MSKKASHVELGRAATGSDPRPGFKINVQKLIESKLLIQANSGGGKSYAVRKLLEQTHGHCQQIVIDPDGEFYTLREKYDYVLAAPKSKECPADVKSAEKLAIRLLELGVSAIIDIFELGTQRKLFVKKFCEALVNAPRELWHPLIIVIDEAHIFAPEGGKSDGCKDAVAALASLGRKRGFCPVLATQRIAKLDKDTAAELNNKLIGRCAIDVDRKRAADELGFATKDQTLALRTLEAGDFYAFGPAISNEVKLIHVGEVETTHLRAGKRAARRTAPSARVKTVLAQLANIPHEADEEAKTVAELKAKNHELQQKLLSQGLVKATEIVEKTIEKAILKDGQLNKLGKLADKILKVEEKLAVLNGDFLAASSFVYAAFEKAKVLNQPMAKPPTPSVRRPLVEPKLVFNTIHQPAIEASRSRAKPIETDGALPSGEAKILAFVIQHGADGVLKKAITTTIGYKRQTRDEYLRRLRGRNFVTDERGRVFVTSEGMAAMPNAERLPTGERLREYWLSKLPTGESEILRVAINHYPNLVDKETVGEESNYTKRQTRDEYIRRLRSRELIDDERGAIKARSTLFD